MKVRLMDESLLLTLKNGKCCGTVLVISCEVLLHTFNLFNRIISV